MSLVNLIRKNKNVRVATANTATPQPQETKTFSKISNFSISKLPEPKAANDSELEAIRQWLFQIGEPKEDHHLVIDKCKADPKALEYFSRHASGEFEANYTLTDEDYSSPDDRRMCRDCLFLFGGHCQQNKVTNHGLRYRPVPDILKRCSVFKPRKGE